MVRRTPVVVIFRTDHGMTGWYGILHTPPTRHGMPTGLRHPMQVHVVGMPSSSRRDGCPAACVDPSHRWRQCLTDLMKIPWPAASALNME